MKQHFDESLRDKALLAQTQNISSLHGLLNFCASNPAIDESCSKSGYFWRETLMRLFGKTIVLQRGDLRIEDWPIFAKTLATGRVFKYALQFNAHTGSYGNPEPFYAVFEDENLVPDDIYYEPIKIPVAVPAPGTQGYFVQWRFDGSLYKERRNFFVGVDLKQTLRLAQEWIALTYWTFHKNKILRGSGADFFTTDNFHDDTGVRVPLPTVGFF